MARKTSRTHAQGEVSRRAILDATLRIASERGYVGTTVAQVKRATGLPASSLYWHFKDKDDLIADALDHAFALWHEHSPRWERGTSGESLAASLATHFSEATRGLDHEPGFWRMGLMMSLETGPAVGSQARTRFLRIRGQASDVVGEWWSASADARDRPVLVRLTMAALDGLFIAHQSDGQERIDLVVPLLAEAIAAVAGRLHEQSLPTDREVAPARTERVLGDARTSRDRLLDAAAAVAAESGYEGASISRICARAGLPPSSLYWHFKGKDDLLAGVVEHSFQEWSARQPAWLPPTPGTPWQDELRSHFATALRSLQAEPDFLRIGHQLLLLRRDDAPAGRARFLSVRHRQRLIMTEWFRDVLDMRPEDAERLAVMTMILHDGLFFSDQLDEPTWDAREMAVVLTGAVAGALEASPELA
ncbi:TetR family transcriptional regulator [Nocardioides sp. CER19]|uniref:TetR/AcrR family transcriptional regulator n=1 Tax=Nocardioides sp. CER19 TaxID=3038538 RepID=UPI00244AD629|nr:TetR family transcriptional regulator [Nocardioides sp. CER19]MDH2412999.1 TetR family transcriptional regulator [Nocardioides sp. CER19]